MSGEVKSCEVYTDKFCEAVCVAIRHDRSQLQMARSHVVNITEMMKSMPTPHESVEPWEILYGDVNCYDDVTGNQKSSKTGSISKWTQNN